MRTRQIAVDRMKTLAIGAVVLEHALAWQPSSSPALRLLGGMTFFGAPLLIALSGYLAQDRLTNDASSFARRRLTRLVPPYVFWSLVYLGLVAATFVVAGRPAPALDLPAILLAGGAYPTLWFMPMLLYVSLLAGTFAAARRIRLLPVVAALLWLAITAARLTGWVPSGLSPLARFALDLPWCVDLFALGLWPIEVAPSAWTLPGGVFLLSAGATGALRLLVPDGDWASAVPLMQVLITLAVGSAVACVHALRSKPASRGRGWALTGSLVFGVYALHPLFLEALDRMLRPFVHSALLWSLSAAAIAVAGSIAGTWLILKSKLLRAIAF